MAMFTRGRRAACIAATAAALLTLTSCGSGEEDQTSTPAGNSPIGTRSVDGIGTVLADQMGMTLYVTDAEQGGAIKCVEDCADFWPPLEAGGDLPSSIDGVSGKLGSVKRPDGTMQVTLDDRPLYMFSDDRTPGSVKGNGFEDDFMGTHFLWHAMTTEGPAGAPAPDSSESSSDDDSGGYDY